MDDSALEGMSLLRIYGSEDLADAAREFLERQGISSTVLDKRAVNPAKLGNAAQGEWLVVASGRRADAEARLAAQEAEWDGGRDEEVRCTACDSSDFSAVPPRESPEGSWYLRCLNCGRWTPVSERSYRREAYLVLPSACPECGSFRVAPGDAPEFDMGLPEEKRWWRCESCEHAWSAVTDDKGPGAARSGAGEPWTCETLEQEPPEMLEAPSEPPAREEETDEEEGPRVMCPRCLSTQVSMNDTLAAKGGALRFLCDRCGQVWDESPPPGTPLPDVPVLRDGDATTDPAMACLQCGSGETEVCDAPDYALESGLARFVKMLFGRGSWRRCQRCGYQWEAGS